MEIGIAEVLLIAAGLVSFLIVYTYRDDKDSAAYKASMIGGVVVGIAVVAEAAMHYTEWSVFDNVLIFLAGFALIIRPFRKMEIAIIAAVIVMIAIYFYAGTLTGDWEVLSEGVPRYIVTLVGGAFVYMVLNFIEKLADLIGFVLNLWPVLLVLGIICIVEAVLIVYNGTSLFDYYEKYKVLDAVVGALVY